MGEDNLINITCPHCKENYFLQANTKSFFCPFCSKKIDETSSQIQSESIEDKYKILRSIGKGGMGEVLLAYDDNCERQIALKRIRPDLIQHPQVQKRFLKEAHITSQMTHPAIIPIYTIHRHKEHSHYTMPFVEGETLKQIIKKARKQQKMGEKLDHLAASIPALIRIFITVCQAVSYAHSKNILHRDLKLENLIIGKYGEVFILDWGLAKFINQPTDDELPNISISNKDFKDVTRAGKVVGTIVYMAPEIASGTSANVQTDVYSLGIILYQLLTFHPPFRRGKTLEEFKKTMKDEEWIDPNVMAPYRDVPKVLSEIAKKCLEVNPKDRYETVGDLIKDLENYIEGRSDWFFAEKLDVSQKEDWEFQENVLIAEHIAITRLTEESQWASLMISHSSFSGNTKIETEVYMREGCHGIGFLLSVPEADERTHISDGYCLWIGSESNRSTKLLRSNVDVMQAPDIFLKKNQWYKIRIEKIEQNIHLYINDTLQMSYVAYIPLIGTHIGLLSYDADFSIKPIEVYVGSFSLMINCLAVPDAFLAHKDFTQALSEYRRIAYSFPDRQEGREAIFRTGLTYIEQAKSNHTGENKETLLDEAMKEFEKLHKTPAAPLEYLGKALVYQTLNDEMEEIKCFDLAYRRYPRHPFLPFLQEQIISRMHEVSRYHRKAAYHFILLAVQHLPLEEIDIHTKRLFTSLQKHWENLPFVEEDDSKDKIIFYYHFAIQLAFWLAKPYTLGEIIDHLNSNHSISSSEVGNALFSLIELGSWRYAKEKIQAIKRQEEPSFSLMTTLKYIEKAIECSERNLELVLNDFLSSIKREVSFEEWRFLWYALNLAIDTQQTTLVHKAAEKLLHCELSFEYHLQLNVLRIWAYLFEKNWGAAGEIFYVYPVEILNKESSPLHFLYTCWLLATEGKELSEIHLTSILNTPYPRTWTLASHFLLEHFALNAWFDKAFLWEKRQLYRQLILYYDCLDNVAQKQHYEQLFKKEFIYDEG